IQTDQSGYAPRLSLSDVTVRFGGLTALDGVCLDVPRDHVIGVMGPNGAGKTTLFNVICGVYAPSSGTLTIDGTPVRPRPHKLTRNGIARTLQGLGLFSGLSVLDNVVAGLSHQSGHNFAETLFGLPRASKDE